MAQPERRPAAARTGRAGDWFDCLAALNYPQIPCPLASRQSDFVARRFGASIAAAVASLAWEARR
jgi:hypothetical protein